MKKKKRKDNKGGYQAIPCKFKSLSNCQKGCMNVFLSHIRDHPKRKKASIKKPTSENKKKNVGSSKKRKEKKEKKGKRQTVQKRGREGIKAKKRERKQDTKKRNKKKEKERKRKLMMGIRINFSFVKVDVPIGSPISHTIGKELHNGGFSTP